MSSADENQADLYNDPDVVEPAYQGEELGGAVATICPGFDPEPLRYMFYQPAMRMMLILGAVVLIFAVGSIAGGNALRTPGGWWPGFLAALCYALGGLFAFIDLIVAVKG